MALRRFANKIFDEHFDINNQFKSKIIKDIILAIKNAIPNINSYEEYLQDEETFEVFLLDELMFCISNKIRNIIFDLHQKDVFNRTGDSDIYYYLIPNDVVKYVIEKRNK